MLNLIPNNWYWSKSLKRDVKFVEIYTRVKCEDFGKAYEKWKGAENYYNSGKDYCRYANQNSKPLINKHS